MGYKNFRFNITYRVLLIAIVLAGMAWGFLSTSMELTPVSFAILAILLVIELIHYVEKNNNRLQTFLEFIEHQDFSSVSISDGLGQSFSDLNKAYQAIRRSFQRLNAEKQANAQYLESVVEHVNVALICFTAEGEVSLINRHAKQLFHCPYLPNISKLSKLDSNLPELMHSLKNNEHRLVDINIGNESLQLAVHAINFTLLGQDNKLVSLQNIRNELEQHEINSWQKLIRVLTHEIMNSVTPIVSLSGILRDKLSSDEDLNNAISQLSEEDIKDVQQSIRSIESRSKGLNRFVQTYRRLTSIPVPNFSVISVNSLIDNIRVLMSPELEKRQISFQIEANDELMEINVDQQQIEQVLINLIKNAIEALSDISEPRIRLQLEKLTDGTILIKIIDNGLGIDAEFLDQIFVPFFTTKVNGSGIGLSISRQLMIQNKGSLTVNSTPGEGCCLVLRFNKH